jgi:hypothetical protein
MAVDPDPRILPSHNRSQLWSRPKSRTLGILINKGSYTNFSRVSSFRKGMRAARIALVLSAIASFGTGSVSCMSLRPGPGLSSFVSSSPHLHLLPPSPSACVQLCRRPITADTLLKSALRRNPVSLRSSVDVSPEPNNNNDRSVEEESKASGEKKKSSPASGTVSASTATQQRFIPSSSIDQNVVQLKTDAEKLASCLWRWGWRSFWFQIFLSMLATSALLLSGMMQVNKCLLLRCRFGCLFPRTKANTPRADARFRC